MTTMAKRPMLAVFADQAGKFSAMVSGLGLLAIAGIICWEVFARYVLNEPTTWVTEIATYILVAVSFLGLAAAQRARAHVQHRSSLLERREAARCAEQPATHIRAVTIAALRGRQRVLALLAIELE